MSWPSLYNAYPALGPDDYNHMPKAERDQLIWQYPDVVGRG